jgi:hypothetical protein
MGWFDSENDGYNDPESSLLDSLKHRQNDLASIAGEFGLPYAIVGTYVSGEPETAPTASPYVSPLETFRCESDAPPDEWSDTGADSPMPTERSSPWVFAGPISQAIGAVSDFRQFQEQLGRQSVKDGDLYFHCMANCQSSDRGPGGLLTAAVLSVGWEAIDFFKYTLRDNRTVAAAVGESYRDMKSNLVGMYSGLTSGVRCKDACFDYYFENRRPRQWCK